MFIILILLDFDIGFFFTNFCVDFDIPYVVDQTNLDKTTSLRNNLRLEIIPQLVDLSNKKNG